MVENAPGVASVDGPRARPWGLAVSITLTGLLLPWAVGVGVKVYLDAHDRPTLPYSDFVSPSVTPVILVISLMTWAFPFLILSAMLLASKRNPGNDPRARPLLPLWLAFGVGVVVAIPVFVGVFREFDAIYLITPIGVLLLLPMAAAYGMGILIARRSASTGPRRAPPPS